MSDSYVIKDPDALAGNERKFNEQIDKAQTTYQMRKGVLVQKMEDIQRRIEEEKNNKREAENKKAEAELNLKEALKQLSDIRARRESNSANKQSNASMAEKLAERQVQQRKQELEKAEKLIVIYSEKIKCFEKRYNDILALYEWLVGEGANELEKHQSSLREQIAKIQQQRQHAAGRPSM